MPEIDTDRLIWIICGVQLTAELGDRPLAYRVEGEMKKILSRLLPAKEAGEPPILSPAVISDVFYLNNEAIQGRPYISIGGPGVNALSGMLVNELPSAVAIEDQLVVQMDVEMEDHRCCVWGMNHLQTIQAVELFISKGYLEMFVKGVVAETLED
jgi:hypothetical protein